MTEYIRITDRKIELTNEGVENLMTEYTPTTEEVRDAFSDYKEDDAGGWFKAEAGFDRWLAEVKAQERERIIKLLEASHSEYSHTNYEHYERFCMSCGAIALIKGEEQ